MPNTTTNFALPFPSSTDAPCDFAQQWCDFTDRFEQVMVGFDTTVNRTVPIIPVTLLQSTQPQEVEDGGAISFDTVLVDTSGMVDMDLDSRTININRTARYTVVGGMIVPTENLPFPPNFVGIGIDEPSENWATFDYNYTGYNSLIHMAISIPVVTLEAGEPVRIHLFRGSNNVWTVESAWLGVAWHADTEVP